MSEPTAEDLAEVASGTLTLRDLRDRFGISRSTAYELLADGSLRSVRLRGRRLVTVASVERLLATGLEPAKSEPEAAL